MKHTHIDYYVMYHAANGVSYRQRAAWNPKGDAARSDPRQWFVRTPLCSPKDCAAEWTI